MFKTYGDGDPNMKMLENGLPHGYVWKAIVKANSLMIVYLVVYALVCIHTCVKINV